MQTWQRRLLGTLALGGGFLGLVVILTQILQGASAVSLLLYIPFSAVFAWGVWAGIAMLESHPDALQLNKWYWAVQIPYFLTQPLSAFFYSGGAVLFGFQIHERKMNLQALFGSQFQFAINSERVTEVGINIFALLAAAYLWHLQVGAKKQARQQEVLP